MTNFQYLVIKGEFNGEIQHKVYDKKFQKKAVIRYAKKKVYHPSLPSPTNEMDLIRDYKRMKSIGERLGLGFMERIDDATFYMILGGLFSCRYLSLSFKELKQIEDSYKNITLAKQSICKKVKKYFLRVLNSKPLEIDNSITFNKFHIIFYILICILVVLVYFSVEHDAPESEIAGTFFNNPGSLEGGKYILFIQKLEGVICLILLVIGYLNLLFIQGAACLLMKKINQPSQNEKNKKYYIKYCKSLQYLLNSIIVSITFSALPI